MGYGVDALARKPKTNTSVQVAARPKRSADFQSKGQQILSADHERLSGLPDSADSSHALALRSIFTKMKTGDRGVRQGEPPFRAVSPNFTTHSQNHCKIFYFLNRDRYNFLRCIKLSAFLLSTTGQYFAHWVWRQGFLKISLQELRYKPFQARA